jgi:hypothetical protein
MRIFTLMILSVTLFSGCKSTKDNPKYNFADGVYHTRVKGEKQQVYVENSEDSVIIYALQKGWKRLNVKASTLPKKSYSQHTLMKTIGENKYWQNSFDVDILTIPLKYRPTRPTFPKQLSNNLNGVVYLGYRKDIYRLSYDKDPIGRIHQKSKHYGISGGLITGIGATAMNSWVTNDQITIEYDGLIWSKGIAVLIGLDQLTFGLTAAIDHLLDENKNVWIYQGKPYLGLTVGLNLN